MLVTIQPATIAEAEEILALQYLCYQSEAELYNNYSIPPLKQTLEELKKEFETHYILIAKIADKIVGSVRARTAGDTCYIGRLIVHPQFQRQGIGSRLMHAIEKMTDATNCELFTGHQSEGNLRLYARLGYSQVRREQVDPQLELVFLGKLRS